jgi:hypothetical protein
VDSDSVLEAIATQLLASFHTDGAESAAGPGLEMLHVQLGGELRLPAAAGADDDPGSPGSPGGYVAVPSAGQWGHWGLEPVCLPLAAASHWQQQQGRQPVAPCQHRLQVAQQSARLASVP